ncbi:type II toxin-antitoxin system PemK/MazF family toxin [Rufibacter immobilis]|uniref:Type II toxin-antitoxin system PemK/MazF family toxin n=1 Tax=Rufibacter immobilis TaxID=1348778 RepID=A0A3M9MZF5_9BACT|nr:type II toxin-antitoxin system PemK/MazF family toxin [Rufibacter immobilis]RNI30929.1 type II toxin-antitoxin system PemK/MazF family toxin [Rufibacter immobilis]
MSSKYNRGDIVWVHFPFTDLSESKKRPALIISNDNVNSSGDYILMQITSKSRNSYLSLPIDNNAYSGAPLQLPSNLNLFKVFTANDSIIDSKLSSVNDEFIDFVAAQFYNNIISDDYTNNDFNVNQMNPQNVR